MSKKNSNHNNIDIEIKCFNIKRSFSFMLTLNIDILCFTLDNIFIHIESLDLRLHGSDS